MPDATPPDPQADKSPGTLAPVITWRSTLVKATDCSTCKLVGLVLSLHMNEIGGSAFPSNRTLARECSLGISTVREHLNNHLHAHGWLMLMERGGTFDGKERANSWQAAIPNDPRQQLATPRQEDDDPRQQTASPPPAAGPQVVPEQVHEVRADQSFKCPRAECDQRFPTIDDRDDHYITCGDEDEMTPAAELRIVPHQEHREERGA